MTSSSKILANMVINFVDKTLLPILNTAIPEMEKVLDQWNELKKFINEDSGSSMQVPTSEKLGLHDTHSTYTPQTPTLTLEIMEELDTPISGSCCDEDSEGPYGCFSPIHRLSPNMRDSYSLPLLNADMNLI
jgi:hypothetical protein